MPVGHPVETLGLATEDDDVSRADYMFPWKPKGMASAPLFLLVLLSLGCVDLTEPWHRTAPTDGSVVGPRLREVGADIGKRGVGGTSPVSSGTGGTAGTFGAGGAGTGGLGAGDSGSGEGGAGGSGAGGAGAVGLDTVDSGSGGSGTGGSGTGGSLVGGLGTGGLGTGGSGTGGSGTGGSGTGGGGDGGSGTGGSGTGGSGTGGSGTGGATNVVTSGLVAYYPCDQAAGPELTDLSGNGRHADLVGTGGTGGYTFGTGPKPGLKNALHLVKNSQGYVSIPQGALNDQTTAMTIATWLYLNSSADWPRVWDFGTGPTAYMFFTPRTNVGPNGPRFAITKSGYVTGGEQHLNGIEVLSVGEWHHVAVVLGSGGGVLYIDGKQVNANPGVTLRPADLGTTTNNYIGKSQFAADPYLDGSIDDFRVYNRALSPTEVQTLFAWTGS